MAMDTPAIVMTKIKSNVRSMFRNVLMLIAKLTKLQKKCPHLQLQTTGKWLIF
jgi:hypothetical protein